eukprot:6190932-Pleurochrysis_carterae.AAC.5
MRVRERECMRASASEKARMRTSVRVGMKAIESLLFLRDYAHLYALARIHMSRTSGHSEPVCAARTTTRHLAAAFRRKYTAARQQGCLAKASKIRHREAAMTSIKRTKKACPCRANSAVSATPSRKARKERQRIHPGSVTARVRSALRTKICMADATTAGARSGSQQSLWLYAVATVMGSR